MDRLLLPLIGWWGLVFAGLIVPLRTGVSTTLATTTLALAVLAQVCTRPRWWIVRALACAAVVPLVHLSQRELIAPLFVAVLSFAVAPRGALRIGAIVGAICALLTVRIGHWQLPLHGTDHGILVLGFPLAALALCQHVENSWRSRPTPAGRWLSVLFALLRAAVPVAVATALWSTLRPAPTLVWFWSLGGLMSLAYLLPFVGFGRRVAAPTETRPTRVLPLLVAGALVAGATLWQVLGTQLAETQRTALFVNSGGVDWHRPRVGTPSGFESGMFGLLPAYLQADGYRCDAAREPDELAAKLPAAQVLVTINCDLQWDEAMRELVRGFVDRGGSLLVLADHTDVFRQLEPTNTLVEQFGMRLRFDSAFHVAKPWSVAGRSSNRLGVDVADNLAIGCSFDIRAPAKPLLVGQYAFSDAGMAGNVAGSYLGNYTWAVGEPIGGVVTAAMARVGRGKVVALGDTSAFQNGVLPSSYADIVLPLFEVMARRDRLDGWFEWSVDVLLLGLLLTALFGRGATRYVAVLLAIWTYCIDRLPAAECRPATAGIGIVARDVAPVDGHYEQGYNATGALYAGLQRRGARALDGDLGAGGWHDAACVAICAPGKTVTAAEAQQLHDYMVAGGAVLLAAGYDARRSVAGFLARYGLAYSGRVLGSVPRYAKAEELQPRCVEATEIVPTDRVDDATRCILQCDGAPIAWLTPVGKGRLCVVGDSRFFSAQNVGTRGDSWPGNIRFIDAMMQNAIACEGVPAEDLFPSFEKPR